MRRTILILLASLMVFLISLGEISPGIAKEENEQVPLSAGCNPVTWTGSDNTSVQAIVDLVKLPKALTSAWKLNTTTRKWLGFDPFGPSGANDYFAIDNLDVIFLCVDDFTWWYRPALSSTDFNAKGQISLAFFVYSESACSELVVLQLDSGRPCLRLALRGRSGPRTGVSRRVE